MNKSLRYLGSCWLLVNSLVGCADDGSGEDSPVDSGVGPTDVAEAGGNEDDGSDESADDSSTVDAGDIQSDDTTGPNTDVDAATDPGPVEGGSALVLPNPIHVSADADAAIADGTEEHPFAALAAAVDAISASNLESEEPWVGKVWVHAGRYEVPETVAFARNVDLEIDAGVTVALGFKANIHTNADVKVLGTEEEPVLFTWLNEGQPWGSFTNFVETSVDNVFTWAIFEYAGEATYQGTYVRGALSLEKAGGLISHCTFRDNQGDDGLSLGKSPTLIEYSNFLDNLGDAFDADGESGAEMAYCHFEGNVNDGIDLGEGADLYAHHNVMLNNGDKGISVGETSFPMIEHNLMVGNFMGIGIKDGSEPVISNNTIYANRYGISSYEAVAGLGSGKGTVTNTIIWGSTIADVALVEGAPTQYSHSCVQSGTYVSKVTLSLDESVEDSDEFALEGEGIISQGAGCDDPMFVDPEGLDFHLMSTAGHWDVEAEDFVEDEVTSPCIDMGDPDSDVGDEPDPNGGRIDLGHTGGTAEASRSAPHTPSEPVDSGTEPTPPDAGPAPGADSGVDAGAPVVSLDASADGG